MIVTTEQRALARILVELEVISWQISVNTDDIGHRSSNSCIYFRKLDLTDQEKRDGDIFSFSPSGEDNILLIDVPQFLERELVESVRENCRVEKYQVLEIREDQETLLTSRIVLTGFSWSATGDQAIAVRKMMMNIIKTTTLI